MPSGMTLTHGSHHRVPLGFQPNGLITTMTNPISESYGLMQDTLTKWGLTPSAEQLDVWRQTLDGANAKGTSESTKQLQITARLAFNVVLKKLGLDPNKLRIQSSYFQSWDEERYALHATLLSIYISEVTQTHERASTSVRYARSVAKTWQRLYKTVLWPEPMFDNIKPMIKGLEKIKDYAKRERNGFSAPDVAIIVQTLHRWERQGRKIGPNSRDRWDQRLVANVAAAITFTYGNMYRFGDATCPEGEKWCPEMRLSRASVRFAPEVPGMPREVGLDPPTNKTANQHTGRQITGVFSDDCINWPSALDHLLAVDAVPQHLSHKTPLFRDSRKSPLDGQLRDGSFAAGGVPLDGAFVRRTLKTIVRENAAWFGDRTEETFGLHSFRIGKLNDCLDAGASYFQCLSLGRWASDSVFKYHRMSKARAHEWQRKSAANAFDSSKSEMRRAGVEEAVVEQRTELLTEARGCAPFYMRTSRTAVPRKGRLSGRAMAILGERQTTLNAWMLPVRAKAQLI